MLDDLGQRTEHPHDPRNGLTDREELVESTKTALENALHFVNKALRVLAKEGYPDVVVTLAMDDAIVELGGVAPDRCKKPNGCDVRGCQRA